MHIGRCHSCNLSTGSNDRHCRPGRSSRIRPRRGIGFEERQAGAAELLARLNDLTLDELRAEWRRLYRSAPPRLSRDLMRRAIALSLLFISSGPSTDLSPPVAARFSPRRRQGVFWKRRLDLSACHRQGFRRGRKRGESMAIPVASSSPHENPQTELSGVQAASRSYRLWSPPTCGNATIFPVPPG